MLWKCCTMYSSKFGKLSSGHRAGKGRFSFQSQRKAMPKNAQTTARLHSSHTLAKYAQNSKPGFNSTWTVNFQMFKLDLEKAQEPEIKLPTSIGSSKKQESSRKTSNSALLTMPKPLTMWITTNCGTVLKRWNTRPPDLPPEKPVCRSRSNSRNWTWMDLEQQTGSILGKEYVKAVYCHPAYLIYMHNTTCEMPGWMKHKLESRLPGEI